MTTTFFLLRHAAHDNVGGYLAGRMEGVRLGPDGIAQAERLAQRMKREQFVAIHASPRERTQQTARHVGDAAGIPEIVTEPALDEIDFGAEWAGKDFETLNQDPRWRRWNEVRSLARTAGGESMLDVQFRALGLVERMAAKYVNAALVMVTHSDVIKVIVSHVLGLPVDAWHRFEISPASISTVVRGDWGAKLLGLNEVIA